MAYAARLSYQDYFKIIQIWPKVNNRHSYENKKTHLNSYFIDTAALLIFFCH